MTSLDWFVETVINDQSGLVRNSTPEHTCTHKVLNADQGPVVQSIVSLTSSLRRQLVKFMPSTLSNPLLLFFENL